MAIEYYVKQKMGNGVWKSVETCTTSEQATRQMRLFRHQNPDKDFAVIYSNDALTAYEKRMTP